MKRIAYLDIARGIAIFLVILGHTLPQGTLKILIYSFHMPLFFFLSGYVFRPVSFRILARRKARQLLLPYGITCVLLILFSVLLLVAKGEYSRIPGRTAQLFFAALYGSGLDQTTPFCIPQIGAIWFLWALFWGLLLLNLLLRLRSPYPLLILLFLAGLYTASRFWLPLSLQPAMTGVFYLYLGYQARQNHWISSLGRPSWKPWLSAFFWLLFTLPGGEILLAGNQFPRLFLNLPASVCGTLSCLFLSRFLHRRTTLPARFFQWMGTETLLILCVHLLELRLFPWYLVRSFLTDPLSLGIWSTAAVISLCKIAIAAAAVAAKHTLRHRFSH